MVDYQPVQVSSVASMDRRTLVSNITVVAKAAQLFGLPVILSAETAQQCRELLFAVEGR